MLSMVHPVRLDHKVFKVWTSFPAFYAAEIDKYLNDGQMMAQTQMV
jgi:hypothetical protein